MRQILTLLLFLAMPSLAIGDELLDLDAQRGKVVIVDFWASWCVPCRRSFPWMNEMHHKYAADGLVIIAVNLDREGEDSALFLQKYPADFQIVFDPGAVLARKFAVEVMPSSIIIGRDGGIIERHAGFKVKRQDDYETLIRAALSEELDE